MTNLTYNFYLLYYERYLWSKQIFVKHEYLIYIEMEGVLLFRMNCQKNLVHIKFSVNLMANISNVIHETKELLC